MYNVLFISTQIEQFVASWGAVCSPQPYESADGTVSGFILPLGWEEELTARGIDFSVIQIEEETE